MSGTDRPSPSEHHAKLATAEALAKRMDAAFRIPGTGIRVGLDSVLGLVPGIGDTLALAPSVYILKLARDTGAPHSLLLRMAANLGVDWLIGLVPLIGDLFDVGWKANLRNVALMREHIEGVTARAVPATA
jgi:hypothetical protein